MLQEVRLAITTNGSGAATVNAVEASYGEVYAVKLAIGSLAATTDITLSYTNAPDAVDVTLLTLTDQSASALYYPRHQVHGSTGSGLTLDATQIAFAQPIIAGRLKAVVAQGGDTKSGVLLVYIERD